VGHRVVNQGPYGQDRKAPLSVWEAGSSRQPGQFRPGAIPPFRA